MSEFIKNNCSAREIIELSITACVKKIYIINNNKILLTKPFHKENAIHLIEKNIITNILFGYHDNDSEYCYYIEINCVTSSVDHGNGQYYYITKENLDVLLEWWLDEKPTRRTDKCDECGLTLRVFLYRRKYLCKRCLGGEGV